MKSKIASREQALASGLVGADNMKWKHKLTPEWKPKFTEAELEEIRALPKRQRSKAVKALQEKYFNEDPEAQKPREWLRFTESVEMKDKEEVLEL